jgi:phosphoribosylformimino-5-aminoimidazole carboxamide ribotide isomerase
VLDLAAGRAVHARAGAREHYLPVTSVAGSRIDAGDALALASAYLDQLGLSELYAADLDAIAARGGHDTLITALSRLGVPLWLDAGVSSADQAQHARDLGASTVIVGLETLRSYDALAGICDEAGSGSVALSLDLRNGRPVCGFPNDDPPEVVAARAADAGAQAVIVIDLARVGMNVGLDLALIGRLRAAVPAVTLVAGGGIRGAEDLARLGDAGCDGALVATALLEGRLSAADVAAARSRQPSAMR